MNEEPKKENPPGSGWVKIAGLFLAFVPSALVLALINKKLDENSIGALCLASFVCCVISSLMLFRRGTTWSIIFGAVFLMLNAAISILSLIFIGCTSMLKS